MSTEQEDFRYDKMVEAALRGVVKTALEEVIEKGLFDDHHFYITFRTDYPGVEIPDYLKERYPGEMTIVLQHQFYDLEVDDKRFIVMLKFNNVPERLRIPLQSITIFTDPSVNFALQFQPLSEEDLDDDYESQELDIDDEDGDDGAKGEVISLDKFRAKSTDIKKGDNDADEASDDAKSDKKDDGKKDSKKDGEDKKSDKKSKDADAKESKGASKQDADKDKD